MSGPVEGVEPGVGDGEDASLWMSQGTDLGRLGEGTRWTEVGSGLVPDTTPSRRVATVWKTCEPKH